MLVVKSSKPSRSSGSTADASATNDQSMATRLRAEAALLFRSQGYSNTTIRQLGERLGVTGATLYHYTSNKESLLYEICLESLQRISTDLKNARAGMPGSLDRLRSMFRAHTVRALGDRDLHATMLTEFRELSAVHRQRVVRERGKYESLWRQELEAGQAAGVIRSDISAKLLTLSLLNLLNWTIFWYEPDGDLSPEELADVFANVYLEGAAVKE